MGGLIDLITVYRRSNGKRVNVLSATIDDKTFMKAIDFCKHHMDDEPSTKKTVFDDITSPEMSPWDKQFISIELQDLLDLADVADRLDIKKLMVVTSKEVSHRFSNMSKAEKKKYFNIIDDDFTEYQKHMIRLENDYHRYNWESLY
ncbi:hypothetical protein GGI15_004477 [Coemansia interrupta]|uniref:SKP1 component dimerisation domain-containing protein n=1 Tax=Coemansia interrupta TaxID=1126814 RepID=A0A9W8H3N0_9FUNG|nr:hypothetical protein GGI15_004477 [Coemansia interrupta]